MANPQYQLTVRKGPKVGEIFLLETFSLTVGRDPVSDVVLNDPEVSRQHARFTQTNEGYQVQDLGSTNGTFVNGERLESDAVDLQPGFTISMGSGVTLLYEAVPTGDTLAATMVDQSGLGEMVQAASGLNEVDEALEAAAPDLPDPDDLGDIDEPEIPADWVPDPSPPFAPSPPQAEPPLVPTANGDSAAQTRRRNTIIAVVALVLLCCCAFIAFMWFFGGDWLLENMGLV